MVSELRKPHPCNYDKCRRCYLCCSCCFVPSSACARRKSSKHTRTEKPLVSMARRQPGVVGAPQQPERRKKANNCRIFPTPDIDRDPFMAPPTMPATTRRQGDRSIVGDTPRRSEKGGNRRIVSSLRRGRCRRRRPPRAELLLLLLASVLYPDAGMIRVAHGQYKTGTALFAEKMAEQEAELTEALQGGEYVEDTFFPERQVIYDAIASCF